MSKRRKQAVLGKEPEERIVRWGFGPLHDRAGHGRRLRPPRPLHSGPYCPGAYGGYDCRNDQRIWLELEQRIPNPAIERADWLEVVSQNSAAAKETTKAR
jgi:hypothetical protein